MRIDGAKVYETGCKYIMYKDLIGYNMKRLDDIRKEINSAWQGRDYNTFSNSFGKHINEITPLLNYLENEAEILKKALSRYALMLADEIHAKAVVAFSYSWNLARYLSALKPNIPVISFTEDFETHYSMGINFGVFSKKIRKFSKHMSEDQEIAIEALKEEKMITWTLKTIWF